MSTSICKIAVLFLTLQNTRYSAKGTVHFELNPFDLL